MNKGIHKNKNLNLLKGDANLSLNKSRWYITVCTVWGYIIRTRIIEVFNQKKNW
jgi:hypothetical protein